MEHKCWPREMLEICGVSEAQIPKLYESWETVEPDPEVTARYEKQYQKFRTIYPALKTVFPNLK